MQNKGIVIVLSVLLTLASIFYLSFSVATSYYDGQAAKIKDPVAQQDYKDSVKYLGIYSYKKCLDTQISIFVFLYLLGEFSAFVGRILHFTS